MKIEFGYMKLKIKCLSVVVCALCAVTADAQPMAGTDELGRTLVQNETAGDKKEDRAVALFYFLWQGDENSKISPKYYDLDEIASHHPEVFEDDLNQYWGGARGSYYFWAKPLYGYYSGDDYWVHRRNIQLLTDADVDLLVIDATNRLTYAKQAESLMQAMDEVRKQGKNPPKIAFYTNTKSGETMQELYDIYYKEGAQKRHPDCWFYLEDKPLVIGVSKEAKGTEIEKFFTIREAQWPNQPQVKNGWPWISFSRRPKVHYNHLSEAEIINVSVAQHPNPAHSLSRIWMLCNRNVNDLSFRQMVVMHFWPATK